MEKTKIRNSNLEILRIVSMILIIMHHYVVHGGFCWESITTNKIILEVLSLGGKLGVNCFVLITGYFMINSKISIKKILKLVLEVLFYSISIFAILYFTKVIKFNVEIFKFSFFPITRSAYWFATTYTLLYLFIPFINKLIDNLNKKEHLHLCLILTAILSVIPNIIMVRIDFSNIGWFITLYAIAAYIRKYPNKYTENMKNNVIYASIVIIFLIFWVVEFNFLGLVIPKASKYIMYFGDIDSFLLLILSISLFLIFKNLKVKNSKFINLLASSTFGVYLIHDNKLVRNYIWVKLLKNNTYAESPYLILHLIISVISVFVICTIIDQVRIHIIEKKIVEKLIDKIYNLYYKIKSKNISEVKEIKKDDEKVLELK